MAVSMKSMQVAKQKKACFFKKETERLTGQGARARASKVFRMEASLAQDWIVEEVIRVLCSFIPLY